MTKNDGVLITVGYQLARVTPEAVGELLAKELAYPANEFHAGGGLGYQRRRRRRLLVRSDEAGGVLVPTGLVGLVRDKLCEAGYRITVEDRREFDHRLRPCANVVDAAHPDDRDFLRAAADTPRALIETRGPADLVRNAALLCSLFPRARGMVAWSASRRKLRELRRRLQDTAGVPFHRVEDYPWPPEAGWLVCSLEDCGRHKGDDFDLVIVVDALQALAPAPVGAFKVLRYQRVYGFVPPDLRLSVATRLGLLARFGPIHRAPSPCGAEAAVTVLWVQPPWAPPVGDIPALERKRLAYWRDDERNDLIATVATAFRAADQRTLWEHGLLLADGDDGGVLGQGTPAVTVLVESTEHGRELLRRLPCWELRDAVPVRPGHKPPLLNPWTVWLLDRRVITYAAATHLETVHTDVLICAGPEWPLTLKGFPPRSAGPARRVLLVDVADDSDATARAAVRRRLRAYAARGWPSVGAPSWAVRDDGRAPAERGRQRGARTR
jgi:hypothetical protein